MVAVATRSESLRAYLSTLPGRCPNGYAENQHPSLCQCDYDLDEWTTFRRALRTVAIANNGLIRQRHMRDLIRGHIDPKAIGRCYSRAIREHVIHEVDREKSNDHQGRNTNKWEPIYRHGPKP